MSKIQRYNTMPWPDPHTLTITQPSDDGMFVLHSDHLAAMQAKDEEIAALRARLENAVEWEEMTDEEEFGFGELLLVKTRDKYGDTRTRYMTAQYYPRDDARMTPYERFCSKHCYARKSISHFARMKEPQ